MANTMNRLACPAWRNKFINTTFEELPNRLVTFLEPITKDLCYSSEENYAHASMKYRFVYTQTQSKPIASKPQSFVVVMLLQKEFQTVARVKDTRVGAVIAAAAMIDRSVIYFAREWMANMVEDADSLNKWLSKAAPLMEACMPAPEKDEETSRKRKRGDSTDTPPCKRQTSQRAEECAEAMLSLRSSPPPTPAGTSVGKGTEAAYGGDDMPSAPATPPSSPPQPQPALSRPSRPSSTMTPAPVPVLHAQSRTSPTPHTEQSCVEEMLDDDTSFEMADAEMPSFRPSRQPLTDFPRERFVLEVLGGGNGELQRSFLGAAKGLLGPQWAKKKERWVSDPANHLILLHRENHLGKRIVVSGACCRGVGGMYYIALFLTTPKYRTSTDTPQDRRFNCARRIMTEVLEQASGRPVVLLSDSKANDTGRTATDAYRHLAKRLNLQVTDGTAKLLSMDFRVPDFCIKMLPGCDPLCLQGCA